MECGSGPTFAPNIAPQSGAVLCLRVKKVSQLYKKTRIHAARVRPMSRNLNNIHETYCAATCFILEWPNLPSQPTWLMSALRPVFMVSSVVFVFMMSHKCRIATLTCMCSCVVAVVMSVNFKLFEVREKKILLLEAALRLWRKCYAVIG